MIGFLPFVAAAVVAAAPTNIPQIGSERPHFGYACHPASAQKPGGYFEYWVFMPENRPIGMPQPIKVMLVDGKPTTLPEHEFTIEGTITHIVMPHPPGYQPVAGQPDTQLAAVDARSTPGQRTQAKLLMWLMAVYEKQPDGQFVSRLKPTSGSLDLLDANGTKMHALDVECDDLTGRAAK